jgi:hypothetical protein
MTKFMRSFSDLPQQLARWLASHSLGLSTMMFVLFVAAVLVVAIVHPQANWDMLAYVAAASEGRFADVAALHAHSYEVVKAAVDTDQFAALTQADLYRVRQFTDPAAFHSMLGMYRVKAFYVALATMLSPLLGEAGALHMISVGSTLVTGLTIGLWLYRRDAFKFAPLVVGLLWVASFGDVARLATPDALFMALLTLGLYLYDRERHWVSAVALFLACLVRSDTIVFLAAWSVLLLLFRARGPGVLVAFVAALICYPLVASSAQHPGFWAHFMFSTGSAQMTMDGFQPAFSLQLYLRAVAIGCMRLLTETSWPAVIAILLPVWVILRAYGQQLSAREDAVIIALVGGVIARFLLFPLPDVRIHGAYLAPMFLFMIPALDAFLRDNFPALLSTKAV